MMRRLVVIAVAAGLSIGGAAAPALAADDARAVWAGQAVTALPGDVNDFTIESFDADYTLSRDTERRSTLHTVERIVVLFPEIDQNRGIIRDLVNVYDGHPTDLTVTSVTDENGQPRPFTTEQTGDFTSVTMAVPEGSYVHGAQNYVIEYTQRDVTGHFTDPAADEFYWDVNGTAWAQPFGRVSARVTVDDELLPALSGQAACYRGYSGNGNPCELRSEGATTTLDEADLAPFENVTLAIGFRSGTFTERPAPFFEQFPVLVYGGLASLAAALALIAISVVRSVRAPRTGRAIIAQYEPPEGMSVALAAVLLRVAEKTMSATLLDLAVRRNIRLVHDEPSALYGAQALNADGLAPIDLLAYRMLFPGAETHPTLWFTRQSTRLGDAAATVRSRATSDARTAGYIGRVHPGIVTAVGVLFVLALLLPVIHAVVVGNFVLMTILLAVGVNLLVWVLLFTIGGLVLLRPRTHAAALVHDHLMGLREYIRLAEADRIRMLQSASGAEVDEQRIVHVYERLLPYAVLFGFETEWQGELARYYRESPPEWVTGASTFSTGFPLRAFSTTVAASPATRLRSSGSSGSRSSFSSSRGGSSGGGFSGGGGGGGGGRGI
jgi:uncharacterized membrane protein YgcG